MDDIRYTFIDELKEFYANEVDELNLLQCTIIDDDSMVKIMNSINGINPNESETEIEDKLQISPIKIYEEEKKLSKKVTMSYNVGDVSIDSENDNEEDNLEFHSQEEEKEDEQGRVMNESLNIGRRRTLDFSSAIVDDLPPSALNDSLLEVNFDGEDLVGSNLGRSVKETYRVMNVATEQSKWWCFIWFRGAD
jgi:predicted RND superfamily exporter protein